MTDVKLRAGQASGDRPSRRGVFARARERRRAERIAARGWRGFFASVRAREWRASRIERFAERQRSDLQWINFGEIADWCAREGGSITPDESLRALALDTLARDLLAGEFDENGRSQVLFLNPYSPKKARMTREYLGEAIETDIDQERGRSEFLPFCWARREMIARWFEKHRLPKSPALLEPTTRGHRVMQPHSGEIEGLQRNDAPLLGDAPAQQEVPERGLSAAKVPTMSLTDINLLLPDFLKERSAKAQESGEKFNQDIARSDAEDRFRRRIPRPHFRKIYRDAGVKRSAGRKSRPKIPPTS
jgi:hypothetical protein